MNLPSRPILSQEGDAKGDARGIWERFSDGRPVPSPAQCGKGTGKETETGRRRSNGPPELGRFRLGTNGLQPRQFKERDTTGIFFSGRFQMGNNFRGPLSLNNAMPETADGAGVGNDLRTVR